MTLFGGVKSILLLIVLLSVVTAPVFVSVDSDSLSVADELQGQTEPLTGDTDGDGLRDDEEQFRYGTNPTHADTDEDGLTDSAELAAGTDPTEGDTDSDGLSDAEERRVFNTSPTESDTDFDGVSDLTETSIGTDPTIADTDSDGLSDGLERDVGSDPTVSDTDSDGLSDGDEYNNGSRPTVADTDSDGLSDLEESRLETDPAVADTDSDGLSDTRELQLSTSPTDADTDSDGFQDGVELDSPPQLPDDLDPVHKDIVIELDAVPGTTSNPTLLQPVATEFSQAPVANPDGTTGIRLHTVTDPSGMVASVPQSQSFDEYYSGAYRTEFDRRGYGVYHILVVEEIERRGTVEVNGGTSSASDGILIKPTVGGDTLESVATHELGHQLGLSVSDFSGIDSRQYTYSQYPSVMNYNCLHKNDPTTPEDCTTVEYTSEGPFNDWQHIESGFEAHTPDTSRLD